MEKKGFGTSKNQQEPSSEQKAVLRWDLALEHAVKLHKAGRIKEALLIYEELLATGLAHPALQANHAVALKQVGRLRESRDLLNQSAKDEPEHANTIANLAEASREMGDLGKARALIDQALSLEPENIQFNRIKAAILDQLGLYDECVEATEHSIELGDADLELLCIHALALFEVGRGDEGRTTLEALASDSNLHPGYAVRLSRAFLNLGDLERAQHLLDSTLKKVPGFAGALGLKIQISKDPLAEAERASFEKQAEEAVEGINKASMLFSLGRDSEKRKDFSRAFQLWSQASELKLANFDERQPLTFWTRGQKGLRSEVKIQRRGSAYIPQTSGRGKGRVFIVGLPRSGSTILETILNSVDGSRDLGESKAFGAAFHQTIARWRQRLKLHPKQTLFDVLDADSMNAMFSEIADQYDELTNTDPASGKDGIILATDKMLYNYNNVPFLARAFPGCRVIHNHRHPLDNFLSMFKENFKEGNEFTYNLVEMVEVYDAHMKIMQEAKRIFPEMVVECHYDTLVQNPADYLSHLFAQLGIEWNDSYLEGGRKRDVIRTASVVQARSKINAKSLGKWKNYADEFQQVREALEARGYVIE